MIDDEIDLRPYVQGMLAYWPLIVAVTLVAAAATTLFSLLQKASYESVALVSVSVSRYNLQTASGSSNSPLLVRAYPELAMSDNLLAQVVSQRLFLLPKSDLAASLVELKTQLTAETASDPSLVRLKVHNSDPELATKLANNRITSIALGSAAGLVLGLELALALSLWRAPTNAAPAVMQA